MRHVSVPSYGKVSMLSLLAMIVGHSQSLARFSKVKEICTAPQDEVFCRVTTVA